MKNDNLVKIKINKYILLDMLNNRLDCWFKNEENSEKKKSLFLDMYKKSIDDGVFESVEFNVLNIVDNDVINWCRVLEKDSISDEWERLENLYKSGERDVSYEDFDTNFKINFIESMNDNMILVRY